MMANLSAKIEKETKIELSSSLKGNRKREKIISLVSRLYYIIIRTHNQSK